MEIDDREPMLSAGAACAAMGRAGHHVTLEPEKCSEQGNKSTVVFARFEGHRAVIKLYNRRGGTPHTKQLREVMALRNYASTGVVPQILCDDLPGALVMERGDGDTLQSLCEKDTTDLAQIGFHLGRVHAGLLLHRGDPDFLGAIAQSYGIPSFTGLVRDLLNAAHIVAAAHPAFATPPFQDALERVEAYAATLSDAEPSALAKWDCNPGNTLIVRDQISGLIDWEQAFVGDPYAQLGILLDHPVLEWQHIRRGVESQWGRPLGPQELDRILAGGCLNVWRKIVEAWRAGSLAYFGDGSRPARRLEQMRDKVRRVGT